MTALVRLLFPLLIGLKVNDTTGVRSRELLPICEAKSLPYDHVIFGGGESTMRDSVSK